MEEHPKIKDFMQTRIVTVRPETPVVSATRLLYLNDLKGVPVVDENQKVVGIFTEYDLIAKGSSIHLPVFLKLVLAFDVYRKENTLIREDLEKLLSLQVKEVMNHEPLVLHPETAIDEAIKTFETHHRVDPIPIVDGAGKLVGVIRRADIVKLYARGSVIIPEIHQVATRGVNEKQIKEFIRGFEHNLLGFKWIWTRFWTWIIAVIFIAIAFIALFLVLRMLELIVINLPV